MIARWMPFITLLVSLAPSTAHAVAVAAGDNVVHLRALDIAVAEQSAMMVYSVSATVDARGTRVALLVPVRDLKGAPPRVAKDASAIAALRAATGPRFEVHAARNPCLSLERIHEPVPTVHTIDRPRRAVDASAKVEVLRGPRFDLERWSAERRLTLDEASRNALQDRMRRGDAIVAAVYTVPRPGRGLRLPTLTWRALPQVLRLGLAARHAPPGRLISINLLTLGSGVVLHPTGPKPIEMPTKISLPEVSFEDPPDLLRASIDHVLRRDSKDWLVLHAQRGLSITAGEAARLGLSPDAIPARYATQLARTAHRRALELSRRPVSLSVSTRWMIRRAWRTPVSCPARGRYLQIVATQQRSEIMSMASLTGRTPASIRDWSVDRGYAQHADGSLTPVDPPPASSR